MPCRDDSWDNTGNAVRLTHEQWLKIRIAEAALCAISRVLEDAGHLGKTLDMIDWKEAGITKRQFRIWWAEHKQADEDRRAAATDAQVLEDKKTAANNKLTAEERALLGIK